MKQLDAKLDAEYQEKLDSCFKKGEYHEIEVFFIGCHFFSISFMFK